MSNSTLFINVKCACMAMVETSGWINVLKYRYCPWRLPAVSNITIFVSDPVTYLQSFIGVLQTVHTAGLCK